MIKKHAIALTWGHGPLSWSRKGSGAVCRCDRGHDVPVLGATLGSAGMATIACRRTDCDWDETVQLVGWATAPPSATGRPPGLEDSIARFQR